MNVLCEIVFQAVHPDVRKYSIAPSRQRKFWLRKTDVAASRFAAFPFCSIPGRCGHKKLLHEEEEAECILVECAWLVLQRDTRAP